MGLLDVAFFKLAQSQASQVKGERGAITISTSGVNLLRSRLASLPDKVRFKHLRSMYTKAAHPLLKEARAAAPTDSETLVRSLIKKIRVTKKKNYALVGADYSVAPHAHLVEFGTKPRARKQAGGWFDEQRGMGRFTSAPTGTMPPNPFFRRAFEATKRTMKTTMEKAMLKAIQKEANIKGNPVK